mgnify:CR=1 FL=1
MTLLAVTFVISGCAHKGPEVRDSACSGFRIIKPSRADTEGTKRQVLEHNTTYRKICPT